MGSHQKFLRTGAIKIYGLHLFSNIFYSEEVSINKSLRSKRNSLVRITIGLGKYHVLLVLIPCRSLGNNLQTSDSYFLRFMFWAICNYMISKIYSGCFMHLFSIKWQYNYCFQSDAGWGCDNLLIWVKYSLHTLDA